MSLLSVEGTFCECLDNNIFFPEIKARKNVYKT